jgi:hypothetical protein
LVKGGDNYEQSESVPAQGEVRSRATARLDGIQSRGYFLARGDYWSVRNRESSDDSNSQPEPNNRREVEDVQRNGNSSDARIRSADSFLASESGGLRDVGINQVSSPELASFHIPDGDHLHTGMDIQVIPADAWVDSTKAGKGIAYRWRWWKNKQARLRGSKYIVWLSPQENRTLLKYYKTKERIYAQLEALKEAKRANNKRGSSTICGNSDIE